MRDRIERIMRTGAIFSATVTVLAFLTIMFTPYSQAAITCPSKTAGQTLTAANWMACRADLIAGQFWDSSGLGSNYILVTHDGTDAKVTTNTGDLRLMGITGKQVEASINGTDVLVIGGAGITASQTIAGAGNLGITGSIEVDGRAQFDGAAVFSSSVGITGATTIGGLLTAGNNAVITGTSSHSGAATFSSSVGIQGAATVGGLLTAGNNFTTTGTIAATSDANISGAANITGAVTTGSTMSVSGIGTFNSGVKFKQSGAGSSTMDYYATGGTFTPALAYSTVGTSSWTFSVQTGFYTRIGNVVYYNVTVVWTAHSAGTGAGNLQITGFPFTSLATAGSNTAFAIYHSGVTMPTGSVQNVCSVSTSSTVAICYGTRDATTPLTWAIGTAGFSVPAAGSIIFSGFYFI